MARPQKANSLLTLPNWPVMTASCTLKPSVPPGTGCFRLGTLRQFPPFSQPWLTPPVFASWLR